MPLNFNTVIRITDKNLGGIYRIIARPAGHDSVFLFRMKDNEDIPRNITEPSSDETISISMRSVKIKRVPTEILLLLQELHSLQEVDLEVDAKLLFEPDTLSPADKRIFDKRSEIAPFFLDHQNVCDALLSRRGIGSLIAEIRKNCKVSRATCYRLWDLLCLHGFNLGALNPRYDLSGAPGKLRLCDAIKKKAGRKTLKERLKVEEPFLQVGVTEEMRQKIVAAHQVIKRDPKLKFGSEYTKIIANCFVQSYRKTQNGLVPIDPVQGTYPNKQQVRRIIHQAENKLQRKMAKTTAGHFTRNFRGLFGKSWNGIAGPGHVYAIDSTIGDIFLRSSINRAWCIGRPIVYIVVDVWSTAVVGFYVCLSGPSWETAKVALFSTISNPAVLGELWGYEPTLHLSPSPNLPHAFLCDRGEYLSKGAAATGHRLGVNMQYNPSYRPDLKGIVEVLNRIAKDQQFQFIPGTIDARRRELELRANPRDSLFTLQEYVIYLSGIFAQYNFFSDRSHRLNTEMMAAGVDPTPSGLWRFGHEVGIGYQKEEVSSRLITSLLPTQNAIIRKDGVYFGGLKYEAPFVQEKEWPAFARNFGVMEERMHYFPGSNSQIWWSDPEKRGLDTLTLSPTALASPRTSFDEWLDVRTYEKLKANDREHCRIVGALQHHNATQALITNAKEKTAEAEANYQGPLLGLREAKSLENTLHQSGDLSAVASTPSDVKAPTESRNEVYEDLMNQLFSLESSEQRTS